METILRINGVERLIIYGIATDYCVRATALDGRAAGFPVTVVEDLCRGVSRETTAAAIAEMKRMGVMVTPTLDEILREVAP
jgi:nicotinamidase/pyrazinamidase